MSNDPREFAQTAAQALTAYADVIERAHRAFADPENPDWMVCIGHKRAEDMIESLPIIARFLSTIFEETEA
ncbi:hypothetical protein [Paenirhodobacter sp. CAU 1674]|uniref:hypothetical protein n=1 Tax=Paenirhodobacter sp. CAU 1674 TaxID=3032596 RepID=UPI0023DC1550|nr:hypothetical protein [Paenirhodobacter sp. CAU 1674]MDF2140812.1 hypothetical protein [Paenirhodobacter sp. CAU 1674]